MQWQLLKFAVSAALIAVLFWRIPLGDVGARLAGLDALAVGGGALLSLAAWGCSSLRLRCLAPGMRLRDALEITFIGLYYGTVLPGQVAGDLMKAYRLSQSQAAPGQAMALTLVDRMIALFALFAIGAVAAASVQLAPATLKLALVLAAVGTFVALLLLSNRRLPKLVSWITGASDAGGLRALPSRLALGLREVLSHPARLASSLLLALVFHALCLGIQLVLAHSLGIELGLGTWTLIYAGVTLLLLLPISIAGLGVRESGYVGLLALFGVPADQALSLSLVVFAYTLLGAALGWLAELSHRPAAGRDTDP